MSNEQDIFPGPAADVTTSEGMSVDDATSSAFDDHQRATDGIAEGERESVGRYLKHHADAVGVSVVDGLTSLIEPAVTLRHGSMQDKRALLGHIVDNYGIQDVPTVQAAPVEYGPPAAGADGQPPATDADAVVQQFISENPIAQDEQIQDFMIHVVQDMRSQGFQPDLAQAFEIAVQHHPHYSAQAQAARQADEVSRARQASGQVSGSGSSAANQASDDLASILDELTP